MCLLTSTFNMIKLISTFNHYLPILIETNNLFTFAHYKGKLSHKKDPKIVTEVFSYVDSVERNIMWCLAGFPLSLQCKELCFSLNNTT